MAEWSQNIGICLVRFKLAFMEYVWEPPDFCNAFLEIRAKQPLPKKGRFNYSTRTVHVSGFELTSAAERVWGTIIWLVSTD